MEIKPETGGTLPDNPAATAWMSGIDLTMYTARRKVALCWLGAVVLPAITLAVLSDRIESGQVALFRTWLMAFFALVFVYAGYLILKSATRRVEVSRDTIAVINLLGGRKSLPLKEIVSVSIVMGNKGGRTLVMTSSTDKLHIASNALTAVQLEQIQTLLTAKGGPCPLLEAHAH